MAISFDWYENPVSPDKPEEKRFHPRIIANGQIDTKDLRSRIQSRCTLNEVDVTAVLDALSQVMGEELCEGRQVHLDGIGYFYPTLTATEEIAADTPRRNTKVKLKGIQFRSDQKLKNSVGHIKIKQMKRIIHSPLNVLDRNGQQTDKKLQINDLWLFLLPESPASKTSKVR